MSFIPMSNNRLVPGTGRDTAKIAIVGDYTSPFDDRALKPFTGPAGSVLEECLHAAGLIKGEVYLTNIFKSKTKLPGKRANMDFFDEKKKQFTELGAEHAEMLRTELNNIQANIIVACGNPALIALTGLRSVDKFRGYICGTNGLAERRKLIATYSPNSTIRGGYTNRHVIVHDLMKARLESESPEIIRPERQLVYDYENIEEALQWLEYFVDQEVVSFDIEVINYEVSCISFSSRPDIAVVMPIGTTQFRPQGWTELEELQIWRSVQRILGNPRSAKIAQNSIFDIHFLLTRNGVEVRGPIYDTMVGHSVMFPELPKGLGFLGSLYCGSQEYWKDSVKFNNIKEES